MAHIIVAQIPSYYYWSKVFLEMICRWKVRNAHCLKQPLVKTIVLKNLIHIILDILWIPTFRNLYQAGMN